MRKTILITGAGSGIGLDSAFTLAARGHQVIATTFNEAQAEALRNLVEATALYLEEFPLLLGERPVITTFHIADVA